MCVPGRMQTNSNCNLNINDKQQATTPVPAAADPQKNGPDSEEPTEEAAPDFVEWFIQCLRDFFKRWFGSNPEDNNSNKKGGQ